MSRSRPWGRVISGWAIALAFAARPCAGQLIEAPEPRPPAVQPGGSFEIAPDGAPINNSAETVTTATLALLQMLEARNGAKPTVQGSFRQTNVSDLWGGETIISTARFWFLKPDLFRCEYAPPDEMTNLVSREAIYAYVPSIEQVEVFRFTSQREHDQQLHTMVIGFGFKAEEIVSDYTVRSSADDEELRAELAETDLSPEAVALLHIVPLPSVAETSPFVVLKLWIDKTTYLPQKIWFEDYEGEKKTLDTLQLDMSTPIDESIFAPEFPEGTEWIDKTQL